MQTPLFTMPTRFSLLVLKLAALAFILSGCIHWQSLDSEAEVFATKHGEFELSFDHNLFHLPVHHKYKGDDTFGNLQIWDQNNRYFEISFFQLEKHFMAEVPEFSSQQTILKLVLKNYLRSALQCSDDLLNRATVSKSFYNSKYGLGYFTMIKADLSDPFKGGESIFQGLYILKKGKYVYLVQHRENQESQQDMLNFLVRIMDHLSFPSYNAAQAEMS